MTDISSQFPIRSTQSVYFDAAATAQKPRAVIDSIQDILENKYASIQRGVYQSSQDLTQRYENVRDIVREFCQVPDMYHVVCTHGTTESFNMLQQILPLPKNPATKNVILLSELEHHANSVGWIEFAKENGYTIRYLPLKDYAIDEDALPEYLTADVAVVSISHMSNVFGSMCDVQQICECARRVNAISIIDGAQSISHTPISIHDMQPDFFLFSGHKVGGLTGCGVLIGKKKILEESSVYQKGGQMIQSVTHNSVSYAPLPQRLEAGTTPFVEFISLGEALTFMKQNAKEIYENQSSVFTYLLDRLKSYEDIQLFLSKNQKGILSFVHQKLSHYDIAMFLAEQNICVRAGHHCCMPLMEYLHIPGTVRISIGMHNTKEDVDALCAALDKIRLL
ncbi:MAG: aminotransferase class V-fold PLP-dependent enzyme [Candidatus Woesearchaeota archaeon]